MSARSARPPKAARAPRRPKMPVPTEHEEQCEVIAWADRWALRHPALELLYAVPNAGGYSGGFRRNVVRVVRAKREGVRSGVPDLCLAWPIAPHAGLYVELKRANATPSDTTPEQRAWHTRLRHAGYRVEVCRGAEHAIAVISEYLGIARNAGSARANVPAPPAED